MRLPSRRRQGGWLAFKGGGARTISLTVSSDQASQYNIFTQASSPTRRVHVVLTIQSGKVLQAGLATGSAWKSGSTLRVVNHGTIAGTGGFGAAGGSATPSAVNAGGAVGAGGDAITMDWDLAVDNTDGFIFGGGGGGGGGGGATDGTNAGGGGGGGGGRGYNNAAGGGGGNGFLNPIFTVADDGTAGSSAANGTGGAGLPYANASGGDGGNGGDWGAAGVAGGNGSGTSLQAAGSAGGAAGKAVKTNGHTLTQVAGFDGPSGTHVKGAIV